MTSYACACLESIEVDKNCHPYTVLYIGNKNWTWMGVIGDNLRDRWYEWNPPLEINLARIWEKTRDFDKFVRGFVRTWTHEEEMFMYNLVDALYGREEMD